MDNKINYIVREIPAEQMDLSYYFDGDTLKDEGEWYCNNVFIVSQTRNAYSFNYIEYQTIKSDIDYMLQCYQDIIEGYEGSIYTGVEELLIYQGLIDSVHDYKKIEQYTSFLKACLKSAGPWRSVKTLWEDTPEVAIAVFLSIKTGKRWEVEDAYGYSQGDHVKVIYCKEVHLDGGRAYGEIWLGAAREFSVIELDESGEEVDLYSGFIVADCQVKSNKDYKKIVCEWDEIPIDETRLELVDGQKTHIEYLYREV